MANIKFYTEEQDSDLIDEYMSGYYNRGWDYDEKATEDITEIRVYSPLGGEFKLDDCI